MSIGRRLIDMARSELNSLLDVAAKHVRDDDDDDDARPSGPSGAHAASGSSAWQDEAEWQRRAHQEVEDAIHGRRTPDPPPPRTGARSTGRAPGSSGRASDRATSGLSGDALRVQKAYAALEVPPGSDFETVRRAYRTLMRKYHPDHHTQTPEKQRAANDRAQNLTVAYKFLEKRLRK